MAAKAVNVNNIPNLPNQTTLLFLLDSKRFYVLTAGIKIILVVETAEKPQLPEAPISFTIMAYFEGFQVLITRRMGEQAILSQIPGVVALIKKLEEFGFEPARMNLPPTLPATETKETGKEIVAPMCELHNVSMVQRQGSYGKFWACPVKNPDGSWCKFRPEKGK